MAKYGKNNYFDGVILPEANGILPPLDASVGGYDLAAIGNPKIII